MTTDQPARFTAAEERAWQEAIDTAERFKPDASFDDSIEGSIPLRSHQANIVEALKQARALARQAAEPGEPVAWYAVDEVGNDNFATSIYESENKGLLVARCNQNGQYPWQGPAIIRGLVANKTAAPAPSAPGGWQPIETAPKDGTLVFLLISTADDEQFTAMEDSNPSRTVGAYFCDLDPPCWQFAGWSWEQDRHMNGIGTPIRWQPLPPLATQPPPATGEGS